MKSSRILHLPATVSDGALGQRDYQQFSWRRNWTMHRYDQDWIEERKVTMKRDLGEMFVSSAIEFHPCTCHVTGTIESLLNGSGWNLHQIPRRIERPPYRKAKDIAT
jgi:hypothetical protein